MGKKKKLTATNFVTSLARGNRTASSKVIKALSLEKKREYAIKYLFEGLSLPEYSVVKFVNEKMKDKDFVRLLAVETTEKDFIQLFRNICIYVDIQFNSLVDDDHIISIFNNESVNAFRKIVDDYVDSLPLEDKELEDAETPKSNNESEKETKPKSDKVSLVEKIVSTKFRLSKYVEDLDDNTRTAIYIFIETLPMGKLNTLSDSSFDKRESKITIIRSGVDFVFTQESAKEINTKLTKSILEDAFNKKPGIMKTIKTILSEGKSIKFHSKFKSPRYKLLEQAEYRLQSIIANATDGADVLSRLKKLTNIELDSLIANDRKAVGVLTKVLLPEDITDTFTNLVSNDITDTFTNLFTNLLNVIDNIKTSDKEASTEDEPKEELVAPLLTYLEKVKSNEQFVKNIKALRTSKNIDILALIKQLAEELPKDTVFHKSLDLNEIVNGIYLFSKVNLKYNDDEKCLEYLRFRCIEKCITENTKNEEKINKYIKDNDLEIFVDTTCNDLNNIA